MNLPLIRATPLWSPETCREVATIVRDLRTFWIPRGTFYTLGAATYQDPPDRYPVMAAHTNVVLGHFLYSTPAFAHLKVELERLYGTAVRLPALLQPGPAAVPGFHVIDKKANGVKGSIHVDEPYQHVGYLRAHKWEKPGSFTVAVELPQCGGGLNVWGTLAEPTDDDPVTYYPYEVGMLYSHDGQFYHQMANVGDLTDDCLRITLQGHSVFLPDEGVTLVYF